MAKTRYSGVYRNENGDYYVQVKLGVDSDTGKKIQKKTRKNQYGEKLRTAKEAYEEAQRIRKEYQKNSNIKSPNMLFKDYMESVFIPTYRSNIRESTWSSKKSMIKLVKEQFASKKLVDITSEDAISFRTELLNNEKYFQNYAAIVYGLFRRCLDDAMELGYLTQNVSRQKRLSRAIPKGKAVVPYWTKEELERVLSVIYIDDYFEHLGFIIIYFYFVTGLRVSEGLAITYDDINFEKRTLRVHGTLKKSGKHWIKQPYTKTVSGQRTIGLDDDTIEILKSWKKVQEEHGVGNFVLSCTDYPIDRSTVNNTINRYADIAKVKRIQAKGLRHSHASYLINELQADVLTISRRLGHSSPDITLKYYAHLWSRNDEAITEKMAGRIKVEKATEKKVRFMGNQILKRN